MLSISITRNSLIMGLNILDSAQKKVHGWQGTIAEQVYHRPRLTTGNFMMTKISPYVDIKNALTMVGDT